MTPWQLASRALALLQLDPIGLGGVVLHGRPNPARADLLSSLPRSPAKITAQMQPEDLSGGVDLAATLKAGALVMHKGLLNQDSGLFLLPMAERLPMNLAAEVANSLDNNSGHAFIALDEGEADEALPACLAERFALSVEIGQISLAQIELTDKLTTTPAAEASINGDFMDQLIHIAVDLGITSLRAPTLAINVAKANARYFGRNRVEIEDIEAAISLVYASRATQLPEPQPAPPQDQQTSPQNPDQQQAVLPNELVVEAVATALPDNVLSLLATKGKRGAKGAGAGQKRVGNRRGRPLPARNRRAAKGARIDLMASLRAAIPWQSVRRERYPTRTGPILLPEDLRAKRFMDLSDRLLIFTVDASGSAAIARLAEAKGAVEMLLSEAYARRDHVALIAFRKEGADLLLPPTRSLVQTKRRLADLPGGGGTPLASGLNAASELADTAAKKGMSPAIILLTDGRANIALDGSADRSSAAKDASKIGSIIAQKAHQLLIIDAGNRPEPSLRTLAETARGQYIPLPRADAGKLSQTISTALEA